MVGLNIFVWKTCINVLKYTFQIIQIFFCFYEVCNIYFTIISGNLNRVYESCNKFDQFLCVNFFFLKVALVCGNFTNNHFQMEIDMHWEMGICIKFIVNAYLNG
jgi:hypothetical protein